MKCITYAFLAALILPLSVPAGDLSGPGRTHVVDPAPVTVSGETMDGPAIAESEMVPRAMPVAYNGAPPPGTLGVTYSRASHPIPEDKHPRLAMLAVRDHRAIKYLHVQHMGGFRMTNDIWLFEADRPLFPGAEHIVRVEARENKNDIQPFKVKFVRLIPGRIVYLDF
jgi:hypothetical protein